ncbi:AF4/FMR2 family member 4-like isoform X3 [Leptopilina boulardi]|uniref:AF4/FMR2 family member 4-like isoform X3 n=1 Tax=Leptopilina boulardi TaxID=63433 RepID=UPI0021F516A0|nr:AF4/FMR2 family member 4-like isoform X3 [Leptopilina boulardi]
MMCVERDRLRERERQARAAMSVQAEQAAAGGAPDARHGHHNHGHHADSHAATASLFRAPVKVNPDAQDRTTQQIQSKLGNYSVVRHLLEDPKRLIGIDGVPASPAPAHSSRLASSSGSSSRSSPSSQEFKKPGGPRSSSSSNSSSSSSSSSSHASAQRGGFVKPADGKPPYGGRGGYPGQPVKHGGNSNDHRSHGLLPAKGPPPPSNSSGSGNSNVGSSIANSNNNSSSNSSNSSSSSSNSNRLHNAGSRLPRINLDNGINSRQTLEENTPDVEDILKEMTSAATPLTAIPQTPRKEIESKYTFNTSLVENPPPTKPQRERHATSRLSTNLERDLSLSDDSEDEVDKNPPSRPIPDISVDLTAPLLPAMASAAGPPLPPMSPMGMSPIGPMSSPRPLSPPAASPLIKQPMPTPPRMLSPTISSPVNNKRSPNPPANQRPPSPPGQAPPSSGSASSSSDSGSDSCSDSSDDSEDEVTQPPVKGPTTPPSVSPPAPIEEPPSAVEESKRRWDLSSFMNKTALQTGDQNTDTKTKQNDASSRRSGSPSTQPESRTSRRETNRNGAHDWQLDEALKRTRNSTMMSVLSDSEQQSDTEKPTQVKEEPEKPKPPDVRKRGRPRKSVKSPKANNHRASDENLKNVTTKRSRPRAGSSSVNNSMNKKKVPTSKPTLTTSDDASDARSPAASSDSESDRPTTAKIPVKRRPRLSVSSNDDDDDNASEKNSGTDDDDDDDNSRWRRVSMKRNKIPESPKKSQDKKKSPIKNNSRRSRSRVTNNSGYHSETDSDSEFTNSDAVRNNRIQVARVPPRPRAPLTRTTSPDNSDSDNSPASGKLQEEDGGNVQDKKKSDTLRKLFSSAKGGGKGGGKGGKGGKGGGKCGIYVEEYTSANTPTGGESPCKRLTSQSSTTIPIPPISFVNGLPSVLCRLDLSRISHIPQISRGKELRQRTELPDTRPSSRQNSSSIHNHNHQRSSSNNRQEEGEIVEMSTSQQRRGDVDTKNIVIKTELEMKPCSVNIINMCKGDGDSAGIMNTSGSSGSGLSGAFSGNAPKRKRNLSCSSVSSLSTVCSVDVKVKDEAKEKKKKRKRKHLESDIVASRPSANQHIDVQPTNHEREEKPDLDELPPPETKRLYFSYFDPPVHVKEDDERDQNQYLTEAKRLKHSADVESDTMAQGMMYIEAVMYFVLTGCTMENDPVTERSSFTMYRDTLSLIKFISSKFKTQHASESSINTKLIVLSLWCQSLIYMKLYQMRKVEVREHQKVLTDYYQKNPSTPIQPEGQGTPSLSPTPSPAGSVGSVGSQSSGYSSGELAHRCANGQQLQAASYVSVPLGVYNAFSSQNYHFGLLMSGHDLWDQANALVTGEHKKFFIELDGKIGPLTLKSSLRDLVNYVLEGINKMRAL